MENSILIPVVLQLLGVVVIIAEIFLPSGGILSLIAMSLFGYSIYYVFSELSNAIGFIFVIADMITVPILVVFGLKLVAKSPVTLRKELSSREGVTSQSSSLKELKGMTGIAISDLRPAGLAKINGHRVDVVTRGEYIEKDCEVVVTAVGGNQIIVKLKEI